MSYLPQHDPGTTYAGVLTGPIIGSLEGVPEVDGPRRKRVRLDKGYVLECSLGSPQQMSFHATSGASFLFNDR